MSIPILKDDRGDAIWTISERAVDRYNNHYVYHNYAVDYWLSLALPHYKTASLPLGAVRLRNEHATALDGAFPPGLPSGADEVRPVGG